MRRASRNVGELIPAALTANSVESVVIVLPTGYDHLTGIFFAASRGYLLPITHQAYCLMPSLLSKFQRPSGRFNQCSDIWTEIPMCLSVFQKSCWLKLTLIERAVEVAYEVRLGARFKTLSLNFAYSSNATVTAHSA